MDWRLIMGRYKKQSFAPIFFHHPNESFIKGADTTHHALASTQQLGHYPWHTIYDNTNRTIEVPSHPLSLTDRSRVKNENNEWHFWCLLSFSWASKDASWFFSVVVHNQFWVNYDSFTNPKFQAMLGVKLSLTWGRLKKMGQISPHLHHFPTSSSTKFHPSPNTKKDGIFTRPSCKRHSMASFSAFTRHCCSVSLAFSLLTWQKIGCSGSSRVGLWLWWIEATVVWNNMHFLYIY